MIHSNRRHLALAWLVLMAMVFAALISGHPAYAESDGLAVRCTGFEDLPAAATYGVGDSFTSNGLVFETVQFVWSDGTSTSAGQAAVSNLGQAGGAGQELSFNNVNVDLDLPVAVQAIGLRFGEYGGNVNFMVNGDFRNVANPHDLDGAVVGGATVAVVNGYGNDAGKLVVAGAITSFAVGGQEFFIDDLCVHKGPASDPNAPGALVIEKSVETAGSPVQPGDIMTYTVRIKHQGDTYSALTIMTDPLPASVELAGPILVFEEVAQISPLTAYADFNRVKWQGELSPGAQVSIAFPVRVKRCLGQALNIVNTASAMQSDGTRITASVQTDVACPPAPPVNVTKSILVERDGELVEVREAEIGPGMKTTFRLKATNDGDLPVLVALRDRLPQGMVATESDKGRTYVEAVLRVAPRETAFFDFDAKLVDEFSANHELINQARYIVCVDRPEDIFCNWPPDNDPLVQTTNPVKLIVNGSDLGDAPASLNHFEVNMSAYAGVKASFPTVFDPTISALGPTHERTAVFHLGKRVSQEVNADIGPDSDPLNNIVPKLNLADRDHFDDGLFPGRMNFVHCERTVIPVEIFIAPAALKALEQGAGYLNIWVDGDRNGDWAGTVTCSAVGEAPSSTAYEHIVIDYPIDVAALGAGNHVIPVMTTRPVPWPEDLAEQPAWIRATLSERPANKMYGSGLDAYGDGSGYAAPFAYGETEDYLWRPPLDPKNGPDVVIHKRGTIKPELPVEEEVAGAGGPTERIIWAIDYGNVGTQQATGVMIEDDLSLAGDISRYVIRMEPVVPYVLAGTNLSFTVGTLDPGERGHIVIKLGLPAAGSTGSFTNVAIIAADVDVNPDNNRSESGTDLGLRAPIITWPADGTTCKTDIAVRGVAVPGSAVDLYVDDVLMATVTAEPGAHWSHDLSLDDGTHTIYAIARLGGLTSPPSRTVNLTVDSGLSWSPLSLRFTNEFGHSFRPKDEDGRTDPTGWAIRLRPAAAYTVSVELCCTVPGATVQLSMSDTMTIDLTDPDSDNVYEGAFTAPEQSRLTGTFVLDVECGGSSVSSSGVVLIDPEGVVYDVKTATPLNGSAVACMQAQVAASDAGATMVYDTWPAADYGQVNPQMTNETGHFSFFTPVGTYRLDVSKSGYQPYRSTELDVVDEAVHYDVPLTAQIAENAHHVVVIDEYGFEPPYLEIRPGEIVEWVNMTTVAHTATGSRTQMGAAAVGDAVFDSGLLLSGESYKFRFDTEEIFNYVDSANMANLGTIVVSSAVAMNETLYLPIIDR